MVSDILMCTHVHVGLCKTENPARRTCTCTSVRLLHFLTQTSGLGSVKKKNLATCTSVRSILLTQPSSKLREASERGRVPFK